MLPNPRPIKAGQIQPGMEIYEDREGWLTVTRTERYTYNGTEHIILHYNKQGRSWRPPITQWVPYWRPGKRQPLPKITSLLP